MDRFVDVKPKKTQPTRAEGVSDALMRRSVPFSKHPQNRAEARRLMRGQGAHMRFKRVKEVVDGVEVRRVVRVRV